MSLRLLADENVPRLLVEVLRSRGHDVVTVQEIAPSIPDDRVVSLTRSQNRLLLTFDKGLRRLLSRSPAAAPPGVILVRLRKASPQEVVETVVRALDSGAVWTGSFAVIERDRIRLGPLPVS